MSKILRLLGSRYPIIQGAMGVICNPEMVAAVSEAGGFGVLASGYQTDAEELRDQIVKVASLTTKPFGVNLTIFNPYCMQFAQILIEMGIKAVTTSAGNPKQLVDFFKPQGVNVLHVCPSVGKAKKAEAIGVDAIIAEGSESGGMQGRWGVSTMVLIPAVVDAVKIPVIAAGGIADFRGFRAARALGAEGVQVGTRFIASLECIAHSNYKDLICKTNEDETVLVRRGEGMLTRILPTPLSKRMLENQELCQTLAVPKNIKKAWIDGDIEAYSLPAGQVVGLIRNTKTIREIISEMVS